MTHSLLRRLVQRGHEVVVTGRKIPESGEWEGVTVSTGPLPAGDVAVYHSDYWQPVAGFQGPTVGVCHNSHIGVQLGLFNNPPSLVTVNSEAMSAELGIPAVVVHPPVPKIDPISGDCVGLINLERDSKVGPFWEVAKAMKPQKFLGVRGGYGRQAVPRYVPVNVAVFPTVAPQRMRDEVWSRVRVLMVPSATESWSMVATEAMAHGVPVVAHPLPGLLENLQYAGLWADRMEPKQWVERLTEAFDRWDELSTASLNRAAELSELHEAEAEAWCDAVEALI